MGFRPESWLAEDWVRRAIRIRCADGSRQVVAVDVPDAAMGSFFYDGLDLLADSGWLHALGRDLAEALGVSYIDGTPLKSSRPGCSCGSSGGRGRTRFALPAIPG
jgi:hypothetical protein